MTHQRSLADGNVKKPKSAEPEQEKEHLSDPVKSENSEWVNLQQSVGNQAVGKLLAQRASEEDGSGELEEDVAERINRRRGGGQGLDVGIQQHMSEAAGYDFSQVRVHTSPEADELSHQLKARAFTTGQDVFFREGEYAPHSSAGQELIAHELAHVVQQSTGQVSSPSGKMTVNSPQDIYEQEAERVASAMSAHPDRADGSPLQVGGVQKQEIDEDVTQLHQVPEEEQAPAAEQAPTTSTTTEEAPMTAQAPTSSTTTEHAPTTEQAPSLSSVESTAPETEQAPLTSTLEEIAPGTEGEQLPPEELESMLSRQEETEEMEI